MMGVLPLRRRWLYRVALLRDIGKLGASTSILDEPGPFDDLERIKVRCHVAHTQAIPGRVEYSPTWPRFPRLTMRGWTVPATR